MVAVRAEKPLKNIQFWPSTKEGDNLKLPAAERSGNLHRKEYHLFLICSLTPPQIGRGMRSRFGSTTGIHLVSGWTLVKV